MLEAAQRKQKLNRVNQKIFGNFSANKREDAVEKNLAEKSSEEADSPLKKTTDFLEQADREIIGDQVQNSESNLLDDNLDSPKQNEDYGYNEEVSGQRALDSDEFEEEL